MRWSFLTNLPIALGVALLWTLLAFVVGRVNHRHATIDVFWGVGFLVIYLESFRIAHAGYSQTAMAAPSLVNRAVVLVVVMMWGLRLAVHLARRQRGANEDSLRHDHEGRAWKARDALRPANDLRPPGSGDVVRLDAAAVDCVSRARGRPLRAGVCVVAIGVFFEATGDEQLRRFIADPANRGATMNRGLWRYTRHPNYFGDAVVWCGFYLVACSSGWGWVTILSPVAMIYLLTSQSGKRMLERTLTTTRAGYDEYVATTSSIIPRPPRKV